MKKLFFLLSLILLVGSFTGISRALPFPGFIYIHDVSIRDISSGWTAGETKSIVFSYANIINDPSFTTVKLSICHPYILDRCQSWNPSAPVEALTLPPNAGGSQVITKATGPRLYERLSQNDPALTPFFDNYQTKLKICPSKSNGDMPAESRCAFSPIFKIMPVCSKDLFTCPGGEIVERTGSKCEFVCPNYLSNLMISDGAESEWVQNTSKKISWQTTGSIPYVDVYVCNADKSACIYAQRNIVNTGIATVLMTKSSGRYVKILVRKPGDISSNLFSQDILVTAPTVSKLTNLVVDIGNGAENEWVQNTSKKISWQTTGSIPYVDIFVCNADKSACIYAQRNIVNTGIATVLMKKLPGKYIKVLVRKPGDLSSNLFSQDILVVGNTPPAVSIAISGGESSGFWPAGSTKTISLSYQNFSQTTKANTVTVKICHPSNVPETCKPGGLGVLVEDLDLSGSGLVSVEKTLPSDWYRRVVEEEDSSLWPYFSSYHGEKKFRLKICPSNSSGVVPTGAICNKSALFQMVEPEESLPEEPPVVSNPAVSAVTISDIDSGWPSGMTKLVNFNFSDFSSSVSKIKVYLCHPTNSPCQSWNPSVPTEDFSLIGSGTKTITKATGARLYERLKQNDPALTPYFNNYLGNYLTKLKICPANSSGLVPAGATCRYSAVFSITMAPDSSSGQGCFDGECVCVNGVTKRCGSPMRTGTGCSITCETVSFSDKLLASLSGVAGDLFVKLHEIFKK